MGLDTTLIEDQTYYVVCVTEDNGEEGEREKIVGCGGWSKRKTLYGGNQTNGRDGSFLDPLVDSARIRAMYTDPLYVRQGIGKLIIEICENKAMEDGFTTFELMATLAGQPLYLNCGYTPIERLEVATSTQNLVPLVRMIKTAT
jgi:GNAT superfamily N-acetyltransferase